MEGIVICVEAYPRVKNALYIASKNSPQKPITIVIPGDRDLQKLFSEINTRLYNNKIKLIYFEPFRPDPRRATARGLEKIIYALRDVIRERRYQVESFNKYLAEIEGCEVFFFDRGHVQFPLVKKLSKRNRLVYMTSYPTQVTPSQYTPGNIVDLARLIQLKLTYGRGIAMGKLPHRKGFPLMSDRYLEKKVDVVINEEERDEIMKDFDLDQFKIFDVGNYSVIYFDDDLIRGGFIEDENAFRVELAKIFNILSKYFPEKEIARKYHPDRPRDETVIQVGDVIPDFIPAEFLHNDNVKIYLGNISSAIANVENGLAVSIIDLISFKNDEIGQWFREMLLRTSRSKILFPKSMDEFEKILIGLGSNEKSSSERKGTVPPIEGQGK